MVLRPLVHVRETYDVEKIGTGRPDHLGRNISFPTDAIDVWNNIVTLGNAEMAARLGSPVTFDRRGNVVWMDNFESPVLGWAVTTSGVLSTLTLSAAKKLMGDASMKFVIRNLEFEYAQGIMITMCPKFYKIGAEMAFSINKAALDMKFTLAIASTFETYYCGIRYLASSRTWEYESGNDVWTTLGITKHMVGGVECFHHVKFVIDLETGYYVRLLIDNEEFDISSYLMYVKGPGAADYVTIAIRFTHEGGALPLQGIAYVDNVIITQNEP